MTDSHRRARAGFLLGLAAFILWGVIPLYFKLLVHIPPIDMVAQRIIWSLLLLGGLIASWRRWGAVRAALAQPRVVATLCATAILVSCNWLVYIFAVIHDQVLAASLGYFLNPLVNVLLGVVLLHERLSRTQVLAVAFACVGVAALAVEAAADLWISLVLACSFSFYGFLRKIAPVEAVEGLAIETALLSPIALGWLLWQHLHGAGSFGSDRLTDALIVLSGTVTAVPLLLFHAAAKRLPYSNLAFLAYIGPSLQFVLAVLVFGERLTLAHAICFGAIWIALIISSIGGVRDSRAAARERAAAGL
ncbi:MAG TPA: EamA family transporter RarD [Allosphingosinicella sp.]|nr:EamA family transporter RarD [Allosphingosinicella sp.]